MSLLNMYTARLVNRSSPVIARSPFPLRVIRANARLASCPGESSPEVLLHDNTNKGMQNSNIVLNILSFCMDSYFCVGSISSSSQGVTSTEVLLNLKRMAISTSSLSSTEMECSFMKSTRLTVL